MGDAPAARLYALDRKSKKSIRGGAAPLRITRRKVHADVALAQRTQDRIDQRMQHHVGIGMTGDAVIVRDPHAAEPDMIAFDELVHIEAEAGANIRKGRDLRPPRARNPPGL
jgi:hypothetical protein